MKHKYLIASFNQYTQNIHFALARPRLYALKKVSSGVEMSVVLEIGPGETFLFDSPGGTTTYVGALNNHCAEKLLREVIEETTCQKD